MYLNKKYIFYLRNTGGIHIGWMVLWFQGSTDQMDVMDTCEKCASVHRLPSWSGNLGTLLLSE